MDSEGWGIVPLARLPNGIRSIPIDTSNSILDEVDNIDIPSFAAKFRTNGILGKSSGSGGGGVKDLLEIVTCTRRL